MMCARCGIRRKHREGLCRRCRLDRQDGLETFKEVQVRMDLALGIKRGLISSTPIPSAFNIKFDR